MIVGQLEDVGFGYFDRGCWGESGFLRRLVVGFVELMPICPVDGKSAGIGEGGDVARFAIEGVV